MKILVFMALAMLGLSTSYAVAFDPNSRISCEEPSNIDNPDPFSQYSALTLEASLRRSEEDLAGAQICIDALLDHVSRLAAVVQIMQINAQLTAASFSEEADLSQALKHYNQALRVIPDDEGENKTALYNVAEELGRTLYKQHDARTFGVYNALLRLTSCSIHHPDYVKIYRDRRDEASQWGSEAERKVGDDKSCPNAETFQLIIAE